MRVAVRQPPRGGQRAALAHRRPDRLVRLVDVQAGEAGRLRGEGAVALHRLRHRQAVRAAEREVVLAVAGGDVDEAGALVRGDEVARQERHVEVVALAAQRMRGDGARQLRALQHAAHGVRAEPRLLREGRQQRQRDQERLAHAQQRSLGHALHVDQRVVDLRPVGDGAVAGDGPGRGGPDHHARAHQVGGRRAQHREARVQGRRDVVVVLDLGLGEDGALHRAPHHGPQAAVQRAVQQERAQLPRDRRLGREVHRRVTPRPVAGDAEPDELLASAPRASARRRRGTRRGSRAPAPRPCRPPCRPSGRGTPPPPSTRWAGRGSPSPARSRRRARPSAPRGSPRPSGPC